MWRRVDVLTMWVIMTTGVTGAYGEETMQLSPGSVGGCAVGVVGVRGVGCCGGCLQRAALGVLGVCWGARSAIIPGGCWGYNGGTAGCQGVLWRSQGCPWGAIEVVKFLGGLWGSWRYLRVLQEFWVVLWGCGSARGARKYCAVLRMWVSGGSALDPCVWLPAHLTASSNDSERAAAQGGRGW